MFLNKNKDKGLLREVSDSRQIVYDFRRRSHKLFENYRAISYKKPTLCDLEKLKSEILSLLIKLIESSAVDSGNQDCLLEKILGKIRIGISYLDDQRVDHEDFYIRYGIRRTTDYEDMINMDAHLASMERAIEEEYEMTKRLWNKYYGYNIKEK